MAEEIYEVPEAKFEDMKQFLKVELGDLFTDCRVVKVKVSELGNSLGAQNIIYRVKLISGQEVFAVDGGFFLDPVTGRFSTSGNPQTFKAVHQYAPTIDVADKAHLYLVARICENENAVPNGGADKLADIIGLEERYRKMINPLKTPKNPEKN
jgi:hypothetical protein